MPKPLILLVEDNPDDELLTVRAFRKNNLPADIEVARDGAEALDFLFREGTHSDREPGREPQLILLDLNLPKVSGLDVLRRLRQHPQTSLLPVVILTSSKEEEDLVGGYRSGANSYVRKPVDYADFVQKVHHLGVYWLDINHPVPRP